MRKLYLGLASAVSASCILGVVSASAADLAPVEPAPSWTGFYVGGGGGYRWADFDVDTTSCAVGGIPVCNTEDDNGIFIGYGGTYEIYRTNLDDDGVFGTIQAGFDWELAPGFVLGVMGDADYGEKLNDDAFNQVNYSGPGGQAWSAEMNSVFTLSARAGFAPTESFLLYGLVGYSLGKVEATYFEGCDVPGGGGDCDDVNASNKDTLGGWTLGAGAEMKFTDRVSGRLEYRYTDLGSIEVSGVSDVTGDRTGDTETDVIVQSVRATINFRF